VILLEINLRKPISHMLNLWVMIITCIIIDIVVKMFLNNLLLNFKMMIPFVNFRIRMDIIQLQIIIAVRYVATYKWE